MNKISTDKKGRKILFVLASFSLLCLIFIFFKINSQNKKVDSNKQITKVTDKVSSYKNIVPGDTFNENKVNDLLGYPITSNITDNTTTKEYRSSSEYRNNQLIISEGKIKFIKEVVNPDDNKIADDIRKEFGIAEYVLYEKESDNVFNLYVYPSNGIAYLGHEDGTIIEIWYFKPTDINTFMTEMAENYQTEKFKNQTSY